MRKDGHNPVLIVIAGPNGSGKTTVTSQLLKSDWLEDAIYINPDIIANEKFGDWNSPDSVRNAAVYCSEIREECLVQRKSLIFETVMSALLIKLILSEEQKMQVILSGFSSYQQIILLSMPPVLQEGL